MRFTDRELVAYVDGELPAAHAKAISDACAEDAGLAGRVRQLREAREALRNAFAAKLDEPVPDRLLAALREPPAQTVVPMRKRASNLAWMPMALAASIALTVGLVLRWHAQQGASPSSVALIDDALLQQALDERASGEPQSVRGGEIMPKSSLTDVRGRYCREYEASLRSGKIEGVACREERGWVTQLAVREQAPGAASSSDEYQPASGATQDAARSLGTMTRMTPAEEQLAIGKRWGAKKP